MAKHHNSACIRAVEEALTKIASSDYIAEFRKMYSVEFKQLFKKSKELWHQLASDMESNQLENFRYAERNPNKPPSSNVVLGSPNHKDLNLGYAYENVPNSLRQTEPTAMFQKAGERGVPIRPSQFITRYGPGALISGKKHCVGSALR